MKYFWQLFWMLIPREGDDDGGGDDDDDGGGGQHREEGDRPDWLAEKFWNPDTKAPRTEILGKAYNELEGKMRGKEDEMRESIRAEMRAAAPENYEVNLSKDLKIPDNVELDFTSEDPMVKWFFGFAKENGMSQETVDKAINEYVGIEIANMPDVAKEIEKLGDYGQDRMLRVHNWLESSLSDEQFKQMNPLLSSATQVEALETLMKKSGPGDFEGDGGSKGLTLEELRTMQDDKRYWQTKDQAFIKKVSDGYKRLYKGKD